MREIKFRCYWGGNIHNVIAVDNKGKPMYYDLAKGPLSSSFEVAHWEKFEDSAVVMQYTGLKDKNGKEIYEGDIVKFVSCSVIESFSGKSKTEKTAEVVWNQELLKYDVGSNGKTIPDLCMATDDGEFEVIGNIYENPELLP